MNYKSSLSLYNILFYDKEFFLTSISLSYGHRCKIVSIQHDQVEDDSLPEIAPKVSRGFRYEVFKIFLQFQGFLPELLPFVEGAK